MGQPGCDTLLRPACCCALALLLASPFLLVGIPPLGDVPGHIATAAIAAFVPRDPVLAGSFAFHWALLPNLGVDLIVAALRRLIGIVPAFRLVCALIPMLFVAGLVGLARALNPRGAAALCWSLVFVWCYPFSFGFLNYMLGAACALLAFVAWLGLARHPALRETLAWLAPPLLFLCHAVSACLFALLLASSVLADTAGQPARLRQCILRCRPLLGLAVLIVAWRLRTGHVDIPWTSPHVVEKLNALVMVLRDQNLVLDVGSLLLALAVFAWGWHAGARPHRAVAPALLLLGVLFVAMPPGLGGASYADMRLLPLLPMVAFATQDFSAAPRRTARIVAWSGAGLLGLRLGVTALGFSSYATSYAMQAQALDHIAPHARVLVLTANECNSPALWRRSRLGHLGDLAIADRHAWTNTAWDLPGLHLVRVLYRPSQLFFHDPSQYVWPARCGPMPSGQHRTLAQALQLAPYDGLDDVWIVDAPLPAGYANPRLRLLWHRQDSALFAVQPPAPSRPGPPGPRLPPHDAPPLSLASAPP